MHSDEVSCLSCKAVIYSFNHLFQMWSAKSFSYLHFFITSTSSFTKEPGENECTALCRNRRWGDRESRSFGSSETAQSVPGSYIASILFRTVANTSSYTNVSLGMACSLSSSPMHHCRAKLKGVELSTGIPPATIRPEFASGSSFQKLL